MRRLILIITCLVLAGCSASSFLAPSGNPAKLYTLHAPAQVTSTAPQAGWQLLIAMPNAAADLNSTRIAIAPTPARIDYYANVVWADRPPAMLQDLLLQSFDKSGRIAAVQRQSGGLKSDFLLTTDIHDFQVEAGAGDPTVHVRITARLVRSRDRTIIAARIFESSIPAGGNFDDTIAAFDGAIGEILPQIVDWTLIQGSQKP